MNESRSCDNVLLNYMVKKSKLSIKEHPHPCNLQWLNKDNESVIKIKLAPLLLNEGKEEFK